MSQLCIGWRPSVAILLVSLPWRIIFQFSALWCLPCFAKVWTLGLNLRILLSCPLDMFLVYWIPALYLSQAFDWITVYTFIYTVGKKNSLLWQASSLLFVGWRPAVLAKKTSPLFRGKLTDTIGLFPFFMAYQDNTICTQICLTEHRYQSLRISYCSRI